jgi:hypothetical protein
MMIIDLLDNDKFGGRLRRPPNAPLTRRSGALGGYVRPKASTKD